MRNFAGVVLIAVCSLAVSAQDAPKAEVFAGLSYANYNLLAGSSPTIAGSTSTGTGTTSHLADKNGTRPVRRVPSLVATNKPR